MLYCGALLWEGLLFFWLGGGGGGGGRKTRVGLFLAIFGVIGGVLNFGTSLITLLLL